MPTTIVPEVIDGPTQILEETPMTESEEKELVIVKTAISTAYADKLERDLAIGAGLLKIFRRKLYRGKKGGRTWEEWLAEESAELTAGRGPLGKDTAHRLRGFYQFRVEVLQPAAPGLRDLPSPTSPKQVRPLLAQLDTHPKAAVEMWKAACAQAGKGKVPTFNQVSAAANAYKQNAANEARRMSAAQEAQLLEARAAKQLNQSSEPVADYSPSTPNYRVPDTSDEQVQQSGEFIPSWDIQKDDSSIDAGEECKRVSRAISQAHNAIGLLRGMLYSQIHKYGSDYMSFLRQVDAGVYSLNNIDEQVQQMGEDVAFISNLLVVQVGEGELAKATIDVDAMPNRA